MSSIATYEGLKGEKTLRFVYCVLNIILALGTILSSFSIWGLVWSAVVIAIVFAGVATDDKEKPVCSYLCRFFLMQCLVYVLVHWDVWVDAWDANAFASLAVLMRNNNVVFLLEFVGTITFLSGFFCKKHNITWLFGLGCGLIGLGVLLPLWSIGVPLVFVTYAENGGFVLALYTLFVLCWTACMYVVTHVWPSSRGECLLLTLLLFAAALSIAVFCNKYVHTIAGDLKRFLLSLPNDLFLWWHVVLVLVVLIVLFVLVGEYRNAMSEVDRSFLLLCANYTLAIRLLMSFYFTYSWILFLLFAILGLHSLSNEATDKKTFCMACDTFLAIEMVAFIPLMLMFCFGLWANVLVTIVFAMLFYAGWHKIKEGPSGGWRWISIISLFIAEAFAYMVTWRNSIEGCIMLGLVWAMAVLVVLIVNRKHPAGIVPDNRWHIAITVCVAVLCIASLFPSVNVKAVTQENQVQIAVETLEKNNSAVAKCYWTNSLWKRVTSEQVLEGPTVSIPIESDVLTVVAVDSKGIASTRRFFYAPWIHGFTQDAGVAKVTEGQ